MYNQAKRGETTQCPDSDLTIYLDFPIFVIIAFFTKSFIFDQFFLALFLKK